MLGHKSLKEAAIRPWNDRDVDLQQVQHLQWSVFGRQYYLSQHIRGYESFVPDAPNHAYFFTRNVKMSHTSDIRPGCTDWLLSKPGLWYENNVLLKSPGSIIQWLSSPMYHKRVWGILQLRCPKTLVNMSVAYSAAEFGMYVQSTPYKPHESCCHRANFRSFETRSYAFFFTKGCGADPPANCTSASKAPTVCHIACLAWSCSNWVTIAGRLLSAWFIDRERLWLRQRSISGKAGDMEPGPNIWPNITSRTWIYRS